MLRTVSNVVEDIGGCREGAACDCVGISEVPLE